MMIYLRAKLGKKMAISRPILNIRFGYGLSPNEPAFDNIAEILADLKTPDPLDNKLARPSIKERIDLYGQLRKARREEKQNKSNATRNLKAIRKKMQQWVAKDIQAFMVRAAISKNGFRERLVAFWADNFTVSGRNLEIMLANGAYTNEAIRANISGKFSDLLKASATHTAMLLYLDQQVSIGPNSIAGKNRKKGLNENLAREILELHTMGVGASYTQIDVREFAKLLTGLSVGKEGFYFNPRISEPGKKTILGKNYGGAKPNLRHIMAFLDDLAMHPQTANHIAKKLATHFISENPSKDLVATIKQAYLQSGGDLMITYEAMLTHEDSAKPMGDKVKWPSEYVISAIRALGLSNELANATAKDLRNIHSSMVLMGQDLFRPSGPDGWSEKASHWINPPSLAARINWAGDLAFEYGQELDPRILISQVLGDNVSEELIYAVGDTESKWEGLALLLISPEFHRR